MGQAASSNPSDRGSAAGSARRRRRSRVAEVTQAASNRNAEVPELLARRRSVPQPRPQRRPAVAPFLLASPEVRQLPGILAGLIPGPGNLAGLLNPMASGNIRVLVMGREQSGQNTDVIFTVQVKNGVTLLTQVPRDTFVETDRFGTIKANSLFALGGAETSKNEVAHLIGAPVQRYFKVNLNGVARLADALGGVEVNVPKRMAYVDNTQGLFIDLYPGVQLLRGKQLEGFLRFRHDEDGDLGRMARQRLVLSKVFAKLAQPATLTRLPALMQIAGNDAITDLSPLELTELASAMAHTKLSIQRLPGRPYWQDNLSYWMPDTNTQHPPAPGDAETSR
jgi:polyisoprenyl-teichoic acid--peptidoglycan teichoic acid transferase